MNTNVALRFTVPVLTLMLVLLCMSGGSAQKHWGGVTFKGLFIDYQTFSDDGDFGAFRNYTNGLEVSYLHNITDRFSVELPIKVGLGSRNNDINTRLLGVDIHGNYHFRGEDKAFRPYALAGVGFVAENFDSSNVQIPIGFGLDFKIAQRAYVTWQSEFRYSLDDDKSNFNHGIGFKYMLGGEEEILPPPAPTDTDGDGIIDSLDLCPTVPGLQVFIGCPDTDGDGIQDSQDECPEYPGLPEFNGCPDTDGDGVPDTEDECPNDTGPLENSGCPINDTDNDRIPDEEDDCPNVAGLTRFGGCPDTDGDGLRDIDDLCPSTAGPIDNQGCPEITQEVREVLEFAMQAVEFEHGSSRLRSDSYSILDQILEIMNEYTGYRLEISGHTDNTGQPDYNQTLSEERAKACYDYLVSRGMNSRRLSFLGYGESRPIATNETQAGRQENRRVEFNMLPGLN